LLVKGTHAGKTELVYIPVQTYDGLIRQLLLIEQLGAAHNTDGQVVFVFEGTVRGVVIFIEIQMAISTKSGEQVTILRQMSDSPNSRFVRQFRKASVATLRMVSFQVENVELALKSGDNELVHADIRSVEF